VNGTYITIKIRRKIRDVRASYALAFASQLRIKHRKPSVRVQNTE
jgi:hypothetical protein